MNSPQPLPVDPSPLPSTAATTGAAALSTVLGYGAMVLGQKFGIPIDVVGSLLGLIISGGMTLFHRSTPPAPPTPAAVAKVANSQQ
jgi:hypothetical protein